HGVGRQGRARGAQGVRAQRPEHAARVRRGDPRLPRALPLSRVHALERAKIGPMRNDTFLRALLRQPTPYTPIWIMRQAGRYLPEYNATRKRAGSFLALAQTPELACEVTLQP